MPTMARVLAGLLLTVVAAVVAPTPVACACSCAALDTDQAMANASVVFDGDVVETSLPTAGDSAEPVVYTIVVTRVYHGRVPATVVVRSAVAEASCGVELRGRVTVFGHGSVEDMRTTLCSAPGTIDRSRLGAGHPPDAAPSATPTAEPPTTSPVATGPLLWGTLAGVLALGGVAIWLVRRTRG